MGFGQLWPEPERAEQRHEPLPIGFCVVVTIASLSLRVDAITLYLRFMDSCQLWCHTLLTYPDNSQCIGVTSDCAVGRFPVLRVWVQYLTSSQQTLSPDDSPSLLRY
jgi:hypothetical protein